MLKKFILIVLVLCLLNVSAFADESVDFADVPPEHWAHETINQLRQLNITSGIGNNKFGLGETLTKAEFIVFLSKLLQWEMSESAKSSFADVTNPDEWYFAPIETALQNGVIKNDIKTFNPQNPITREEMAVMLIRSLGYDTLAQSVDTNYFDDVSNNIGYITMARDFGIIQGVGDRRFKPGDNAKREEAAAMMIRMYNKINANINEMHGFYAISSYDQQYMIDKFDSIGFGWSRLEYNNNEVLLNTTNNNNEYYIPTGYEQVLPKAKIPLLMVAVKEEQVNGILLAEHIIKSENRDKVIKLILDNLSRFQGVVIDIEGLKGAQNKKNLNEFLEELSPQLNGKLLYVAVPPRYPRGLECYDGYDFKTIGEIADKVILMAHDYYAKQLTESEMSSGYTTTPLTPIDFVYYGLESITDQQTGVQDKSKIMFQFSFDTVLWQVKDSQVTNRYPQHPSYAQIEEMLLDNAQSSYSGRSQSPYLNYNNKLDEMSYVVWYEDTRSIEAKINLIKMFGITGISVWRIGIIPNKESGNYLDIWNNLVSDR